MNDMVNTVSIIFKYIHIYCTKLKTTKNVLKYINLGVNIIVRVIVKKLTDSLIFLQKFVYNVQLIMQFNS